MPQPSREGDPLGFVGIKERRLGKSTDDGRELPGEVDRVADASVHALAAHGAVNVRGIAKQKRAALPGTVGDPMVNTVCGKPVDALDLDAETVQSGLADIIPGEGVVIAEGFFAARCR